MALSKLKNSVSCPVASCISTIVIVLDWHQNLISSLVFGIRWKAEKVYEKIVGYAQYIIGYLIVQLIIFAFRLPLPSSKSNLKLFFTLII